MTVALQDLRWAMSAVKPSAMREVAVDVPKVPRARSNRCSRFLSRTMSFSCFFLLVVLPGFRQHNYPLKLSISLLTELWRFLITSVKPCAIGGTQIFIFLLFFNLFVSFWSEHLAALHTTNTEKKHRLQDGGLLSTAGTTSRATRLRVPVPFG